MSRGVNARESWLWESTKNANSASTRLRRVRGTPSDAKLAESASRRSALGALFTSLLHHLLTARLRLPEFAEGQT